MYLGGFILRLAWNLRQLRLTVLSPCPVRLAAIPIEQYELAVVRSNTGREPGRLQQLFSNTLDAKYRHAQCGLHMADYSDYRGMRLLQDDEPKNFVFHRPFAT